MTENGPDIELPNEKMGIEPLDRCGMDQILELMVVYTTS